jgi:hypothetical protein
MNRKGEKIGWIGGWMGGFIWLGLLSVIWVFQGNFAIGIGGVVLFSVAIITIFATSPWRHPDTKYWKLMLPIYFLFFISISLAICQYDGLENFGLKWPALFWILPGFIPFATVGQRTWGNDS